MGQQEVFRTSIPLFQALSDPCRQDIILLLIEQKKLTVNEITKNLPLSRPAVSHHLKILREEQLLNMEQKGTQHYYSLTLEGMINQLKSFLNTMENHCL
ncbi:ArsR/SmtB family transcription factor [Jeotgalibacillus soli]|uniref:ArsR family transcriptional regulator n=1 Tax=Jeotgalibacillus soli TaxID=889306 RepID=A0A0C2VF76_9BACL|nr:metalloregulator ArsR/SmtB family transcription factor [Jeotgalibacillus soli]KIL42663.1 ArsR family transcriptional regulator [Jeotgalibacillus soli]